MGTLGLWEGALDLPEGAALGDWAKTWFSCGETGFGLDLSKLGPAGRGLASMEAPLRAALEEMEALEAGAIANPSEGRMVGHYWLRAPELAPEGLGEEIAATREACLEFGRRVRAGEVFPACGGRFTKVLAIGIGGSALGPQLLQDALGEPGAGLPTLFFDNTDPDGFGRTLRGLGEELRSCLVLVTSKSGGTKETRNGMLVARAAFEAAGLPFARQAVAITGKGSALDALAEEESWLARFPMWDWVGGRTSVCSAVGLVPGALMGIDMGRFLEGAAAMDRGTRKKELRQNLAAQLAAAWYLCSEGRGARAMVALPYRDRLGLFGRYLQQLVMESLGKREDRKGRVVHQGLTVYGNKGSTDQHAYVQQLRDGLDNFFVCFLRVLEDGSGGDPASALPVDEDGATSGDYLDGFLLGTRRALSENGRPNLTLCIPRLDAFALGALVALFERTVGIYASLVDINAYDQPGVEAGKKAAGELLDLRRNILRLLGEGAKSFEELLGSLPPQTDAESVWLVLQHLVANSQRTGVTKSPGGSSGGSSTGSSGEGSSGSPAGSSAGGPAGTFSLHEQN
ncbi:MAG TPA: glucose-6-phosphate isomerase [Planctomycetes bacterium]|nr:glucose-6-phosphate isomerase [Planctomycetota bacterium]